MSNLNLKSIMCKPAITKDPKNMVAVARCAFNEGKTRSLKFREQQLQRLVNLVEDNKLAFIEALRCDLGRHRQEAVMFDIDHSIFHTQRAIQNLKLWCAPRKPPKPLVNIFDDLQINSDPYGVVLVIGAWNFPMNLVFVPVAGAIAAGNCVIIKPSEIATATAKVMENLIPLYLDNECYHILNGGVSETKSLLEERFDYIFFTGSTAVGKIIHAAANKYLTPVTLELGGKSPVYVDNSADIEITTRRILWGKFSNSGQLCLAVDYMLCTKEVQAKFIATAAIVLKEWYGDDVIRSTSFSRLISKKHYDRLVAFLQDNTKIALGGRTDANQLFIEPTILVDITSSDPVMQEEIFGPILPILTVKDSNEAIDFIKDREKPLAMYIFSNCKETVDLFLDNTSSGGVSVNDTLMHFDVETMPFGGVGFSGMGAYHGKYSFDVFSHKKAVLSRNFNTLWDKIISTRYPPYSDSKEFNHTLPKYYTLIGNQLKHIMVFVLGIISVVLFQIICFHITRKRFI